MLVVFVGSGGEGGSGGGSGGGSWGSGSWGGIWFVGGGSFYVYVFLLQNLYVGVSGSCWCAVII